MKVSMYDCRFLDLIVVLLLQYVRLTEEQPPRGQTLLLVSVDGFRWDYMKKTKTPSLDFIAHMGVQAKFVRSAFTTTTYPNHYTMVTGLYPETHGIVSNYMYDPISKARFNLKTTDPRWWDAAEPLWVTNQKQGGKSGVVYWPGYNVKIGGQFPSLSIDTPSGNTDIGNTTGKIYYYRKRVETVLKWLSMRTPPNFIALYFEEPDESGHEFGPESKKMWKVIRRVDNTIGYLIRGLRSRNLLDHVNLIVTSDHGMTTISSKHQIYIDKYVDPRTYDIWDASTNFMINPHKGKLQDVYKSLQNVPHLKAYLKKDIPTKFHYSHSNRITPILAMPDQGWTINTTKTHLRFSGEWERGNHGFSNQKMDMHALFVARGPAFRQGYKAPPFDNVNLYSLLCKILGVKPRANNGTLNATVCMLNPEFLWKSAKWTQEAE